MVLCTSCSELTERIPILSFGSLPGPPDKLGVRELTGSPVAPCVSKCSCRMTCWEAYRYVSSADICVAWLDKNLLQTATWFPIILSHGWSVNLLVWIAPQSSTPSPLSGWSSAQGKMKGVLMIKLGVPSKNSNSSIKSLISSDMSSLRSNPTQARSTISSTWSIASRMEVNSSSEAKEAKAAKKAASA